MYPDLCSRWRPHRIEPGKPSHQIHHKCNRTTTRLHSSCSRSSETCSNACPAPSIHKLFPARTALTPKKKTNNKPAMNDVKYNAFFPIALLGTCSTEKCTCECKLANGQIADHTGAQPCCSMAAYGSEIIISDVTRRHFGGSVWHVLAQTCLLLY